MAKTQLPPVDILRQLLRYEAESGRLFWRWRSDDWFTLDGKRSRSHSANIWNARYAEKEAFTAINNSGYLTGSVMGHFTSAHRVVWAMFNGDAGRLDVDHINLDKLDNRIENLRTATRSQNKANTFASSANTSGSKGVVMDKRSGKWIAHICVMGKQFHIGSFSTRKDAASAYAERHAAEFGRYSRS